MKRRAFLKTPALGVLVAGQPSLGEDKRVHRESPGELSQEKGPQGVQQRMHPDFITYFPGIEYCYVGNGDVMGAIQYSPKDPQATFFGFTLMNPERFCRKWSSFLYHPERGLGATRLGVTIDDRDSAVDSKTGMYAGVKGYTVSPENLKSLKWKHPDNVPVVSLVWMAGECEVEEEFFVPHEGAIFFRRATVRNFTKRELRASLSLSLYANFGLFDEIATNEEEKTAHAVGIEKMKLMALDKNVTVAGRYDVRIDLGTLGPAMATHGTYVYTIRDGDHTLRKTTFNALWKDTSRYWSALTTIKTGNPVADSLLSVSKSGMKAVVARSGKMDAAPWMYNMEWVSDQALAIEALLHCGMVSQARTMLERNLKHSIGVDGRTIESSRWFGYDYTELNQNGMMLYAVWVYLCWTGDLELIRKYWNKIKLCGDFPLQEVFRDQQTKMMRNKREFWERSDTHGIEQGYEMAYQFWVAFGLEKGAAIARTVGDKKTERRWLDASGEIKNSMLNNPTFKLIEDGHLIKRRTVDGRWQQFVHPPDRKRMPAGSPLAVEEKPSPEPDTIEVYPIIYGFIDPKSDLSVNTLKWVEQLWNHRWEGGGYSRYNSTSEDNPPAPWPLASMLVARAYAEAGDDDKVWRVLEWLHSIGGQGGSWFERYGQSITPPMPPVNEVNWTWYEILALFTLNVMGLRPELDHFIVRPRLLRGLDEIRSRYVLRGTYLDLTIRRSKEKSIATVNGKDALVENNSISIPYPKKGTLTIDFSLAG